MDGRKWCRGPIEKLEPRDYDPYKGFRVIVDMTNCPVTCSYVSSNLDNL